MITLFLPPFTTANPQAQGVGVITVPEPLNVLNAPLMRQTTVLAVVRILSTLE